MPKFKIGDIVSVKSHPYFKDLTNINIAGEPINLVPLMVVIEIYSEETSERVSSKGDGKCKCVWFSLKSNIFSDSWFDFGALKLIQRNQSVILNNSGLNNGEFKNAALTDCRNKYFTFITSDLELEKVKETKIHDKKLDEISNCSSLLNFVSPPLQVIDVKLPEEKFKEKSDYRLEETKRIHTEIFFKCRYYNSLADKWTEVLLPHECLEPIVKVKGQLKAINKDRKKGFYIYDNTQETNFDPAKKEKLTLLEIHDTTFLNGRYFLKTFDLIHQEWKILKLPLDVISGIKSKEEIYSTESFPNFHFNKGDKGKDAAGLLNELVVFVEKYGKKKNYLMITYINGSDKIIKRVLKGAFVVRGVSNKASSYLHGFCCKKREMRSFNFNNLRCVKLLKIK